MEPYLQYQRTWCARAHGPILNCGCKEDPAHLGKDFDAVNMDVVDYDTQMRVSLYSVPNFTIGSFFDIPFPDDHFRTIVLGDILEHATVAQAREGIQECGRVLKAGGWIIITLPQDVRPPEVQHTPENLVTYPGGLTSWHRYWSDEELFGFLQTLQVTQIDRTRLRYHPALSYQGKDCFGWGLTLEMR